MGERKKRVGPTERLPVAEAKRAYPIQLTERDINLMEWLASGVGGATTEQLKRLYFPGSWTTCTKRLKKLYQNRLIGRYKVDLRKLGFKEGPEETLLHTLDEQGALVLAKLFEVPVETIWRPRDRKVNEQHLYHLIINNDVRVAVKLAVEALGYTIENWQTDETMRERPVEEKWIVDFVPSYDEAEVETSEIVPDDYLTIVTPEHRSICITEVDTGSEVRLPQQRPRGADTSLSTKVRRYISFLHKEKRSTPSVFEKLTGQEQKGIRLFFITTGGEDAVDNLLTTIKQVGGKNTFWVGRLALTQCPDLTLTRPIFRKAGDDQLVYYPWIGRSKVEEVRHRLQQYGVGAGDIEARVTSIINLAKAQILDEWSERKQHNSGMSVAQAEAIRADELADAVLQRLEEHLGEVAGDQF